MYEDERSFLRSSFEDGVVFIARRFERYFPFAILKVGRCRKSKQDGRREVHDAIENNRAGRFRKTTRSNA